MCGPGVRKRPVTCFRVENGTVTSLEDEDCPQTKPEVEEACEADKPCAASDWIVTDWSGCEAACGKFLLIPVVTCRGR